jgi:hypothetical protein
VDFFTEMGRDDERNREIECRISSVFNIVRIHSLVSSCLVFNPVMVTIFFSFPYELDYFTIRNYLIFLYCRSKQSYSFDLFLRVE